MSSKNTEGRDFQETQLLDSYGKTEDDGMIVNDIYDTNIQLPASDYTENISSDIHIIKDETCVLSNDHSDCESIIGNNQAINKEVELKHNNVSVNVITEETGKVIRGSQIYKERDGEVSVAYSGDYSGFGSTPFKNLNNLIDDKKDRLLETPWLKNVKNPFDLVSPYRNSQQVLKETPQINAHEIFSRLRNEQYDSPTVVSQKLDSDRGIEKHYSAYDIDLENEDIQGTNLDKSEFTFSEKDQIISKVNEISPNSRVIQKNTTNQRLLQLIGNENHMAKYSSDIVSTNTSKLIASSSQDEHEKAVFGIMETQKITQRQNSSDDKEKIEVPKQIFIASQDFVGNTTSDTITSHEIGAQDTQKFSETFCNYFVKKIDESEIFNDDPSRVSANERSQDNFNIFKTKSASEIINRTGITYDIHEDRSSNGNDTNKNDIQIKGTLEGISEDALTSEAQKIETLDVGATQPDKEVKNSSYSLSVTQGVPNLSPPESPIIEQSSPAVRESTDLLKIEKFSEKASLDRLFHKDVSVGDIGYQLVTSSPNKNKPILSHTGLFNNGVEYKNHLESSVENFPRISTAEKNKSLSEATNSNKAFTSKITKQYLNNNSSDNSMDEPIINSEGSSQEIHKTSSNNLYNPNNPTVSLTSKKNESAFNSDQGKQIDTFEEDNSRVIGFEDEEYTSVWALYDIRVYPAKVLSAMDQRYNAQFYDGSLMINKYDILGPLDIMIGDNVKIHGKQELYIVTGLQKSENVRNKFKSIKGFDKVLLKRYIRHSISERYPEIQVSLWDIFIPNDIWSVRNRNSELDDIFFERMYETLENRIKSDSACSQDLMNQYTYVSPEISPTKIKIKSSIFKNAIFCLTGESEENRKKISTMIVENGGTVLVNGFSRLFNISRDSSGNVSSLSISKQYKSASFAAVVTNQFSRSQKYLQCLALGWPTLSTSFIVDCIKFNKWLNYWIGYRLPAGESKLVKSIQGANISNFCLNLRKNSGIESQLQNNRHILEGYHVIMINKKPSICEFLFHVLGVESISHIDSYSEKIFVKAREIQLKNSSMNILLYDQNNINHIYEKLLQVKNSNSSKQKTSKKRSLSAKSITQTSKRRKRSTDPHFSEKESVKEHDEMVLEIELCDWEWVVQCIISGVSWPVEKRFLIFENM